MSDDVKAQIRALALQVQSLSETAARQEIRDRNVERAINDLRRRTHDMLLTSHQRSAPDTVSSAADAALLVKLVLADSANALHQADRDVAIHGVWATLFGGIFLGTLFATGLALSGPYTTPFWIVLATGIFAFLVALIFAYLTQEARWRVRSARRAMDESTLQRPVANR